MGINAFQVGVLNDSILHTSNPQFTSGSYATEFPLALDNINANGSRLGKIMGVYGNVDGSGAISTGPNADSYGQSSGANNQLTSQSHPIRPNGGYFVRGVWFSGIAFSPSPNRNGYVGAFCSGINFNQTGSDFGHDTNSFQVDYEPIYGHGVTNPPTQANLVTQWRDGSNPVSDGSDLIRNDGSAYTRTPYMPPSTFLFHIDNVGAQTLGSGNVKFHFENRPSLRAAGFADGNAQFGASSTIAWSVVNGLGAGPYSSDPLQEGSLNTPTVNPYEYYQVSGSRKLNSRGLSLHIAKVFDNSYNAYGYIYEEDGITLCPDHHSGAGGTIQIDLSVNAQNEYKWQRDQAAAITATSVLTNVVTVSTSSNTFSIGQVLLIQGLTNSPHLNGKFLTVVSLIGGGPNFTGFTANYTHADYGTLAEGPPTFSFQPYGIAVFAPDFRIRSAATFTINEEYYGFVMDTKCTIWSNKASMIPLLFFDLADVWTGSVAKRIAGVAVVPAYINATGILTYQVFFLSEDGKLARYDFTQTNGVLELAGAAGSFNFATNAPAPAAAGEAYGAIKARNTTSSITSVQITSNVATLQAVNTFTAGEQVNLSGLTTATFLNGKTVTVIATGLSGTQFEFNFTHADYGPTGDSGSADGWNVYALYGTMTPDPRTTQTALVNTANVNVYRYNVGAGTWSGPFSSTLTGRHNARNLSEMIVKRDGRLYMLIEDVTVTGGGPFNVSNAFGAVTNVNWQVMVYDPTANTWNTSKVNGSSPIQYGTNMGPNGVIPAQNTDYWYYQINCFLFDVAPNQLLVQGNWSGSSFFVLNTTPAPALTNANLTALPVGTIFPNDPYIPSATQPSTDPISIIHNRDFATLGDRTLFFLNQIMFNTAGQASPGNTSPIYHTPPGYNWAAPGAASRMDGNVFSGGSGVQNFLLDHWTYNSLGNGSGGTFSDVNWLWPTTFTDNFLTFARQFGGFADGLVDHSVYGRGAYQTTCYIPTYLKWTGSAWIVADSWADAQANPYTIPVYAVSGTVNTSGTAVTWVSGSLFTASMQGGTIIINGVSYNIALFNSTTSLTLQTSAGVQSGVTFAGGFTGPISLPYGLVVQFGPLATDSYTGNEFHTFNLCWGNTKYTRKGRFSWAMFAGQTFVNQDTRTVASQNAMSMNFIDTDVFTTSTVAPTSQTPHTATVTRPNLGWGTQATWPKLDVVHAGFDATPFVMDCTVNSQDPTQWSFPPAFAPTGPNQGPYSYTIGGITYVVSTISDQNTNPAWYAFAGNPQTYWLSGNTSGWIQLDLGTSPQTVLSYSWRAAYDTSDVILNGTPTAWTLQGSNTGAFAGEQTIVDTRSGITPQRGQAYNCNGTTGSFRYYRINITATVAGSVMAMGMIRLNNAVLTTTTNFSDLAFLAYGSQVNGQHYYTFLRDWHFARGLKFEISVNNGGSYAPITPIWRSHNGNIFTFNRQVGVTNIRITVQHGFNFNNVSGNVPATTAFGPFYLLDYDPQDLSGQAALDLARLGSSVAPNGDPARCSFDPQSLGVATDVASISIDGQSPNLIGAYDIRLDSAVFNFYDFGGILTTTVTGPVTAAYKIHPFFGFVLFPGAGADAAKAFTTAYPGNGTNMAIEYQWGRRV